ncbi:MAG: PD-(D/E)XK nuclease family protein [Synergistaceae bacterium]|jgi:hypothetical protein|nr:PD-(D/E)XK nuclease family protein [Synergistaceae bacterium]
MITVSSYAKLSSLKRTLIAYASPDRAEKLIYILPSQSDEDLLLDMLRGEGDYFDRNPEMWSRQDLYRALVPKDSRRRCVDPSDRNLALRHVIEMTVSDYGARDIALPPGVREKNFALPLGRTINELMLEDVGPELLCGPNDDDVSRPALLRSFYAAYKAYLEENGLADNSEIPSLAANALAASLPASIAGRILCFVGFMSFTGAQLKLLKGLDDLGLEMSFFMPDADMRDFNDAAARPRAIVPPRTHPAAAEDDRICVVKTVAPDPYSEYECVALTIAASEEGEDVGVMVPEGRLSRLTRALRRHGIPWQLRSKMTVKDSAAAEFAARAWEVHKSGWPPLGASHLLRSSAAGVELDPARLIAVMPEGLEAWKAFLADANATHMFSRIEAFCSLLSDENGHTPKELLIGFAALCGGGEWENRLAGEIGDDAELDPAIREIALSRLETSSKIGMFEDVLPALGEASSLRFSGDDAVNFLLSWAEEAALAPPPKMTGVVSVYVSPPPILAHHDLWIMTDVDVNRYSGQETEQPMLDDSLRERVNSKCGEYSHLPTLYEKRRRHEAMFRRLLATGERATVVFRSLLNDSGEPVKDSPFMKPESFPDASRWTLTEDAPCRGVTREAASPDRDAHPRTAVRATVQAPKLRISLSGLDTMLDCPFAWWCRAARFETVKEPRDIIDKMSLGSLMHEIWRRVADAVPLDGGRTHRSVILSEWDGIIFSLRDAFPVLADSRPAITLGVMRDNMLGVAEELDLAMARADAAGMKRLWTKTEMTLPDLEFEHATFPGRADRVDFWIWPGGEGAVIYDYKIGSDIGYAKRLQLASYAASLEASGVTAAGFCYLCHGDGKTPGAWQPEIGPILAPSASAKKFTACADKITTALEQMREIDIMVSEGRFEARYDSESCPRCDYSVLCRSGEVRTEPDIEDGNGADD